ncbi:LysE family translocator [Hyphococcus luteus]|uniref:LysE family translocator n=1 Tax=Hyphococcus luteus TaxID=2058213 RepID=A0A2S7K6B5_9PROT|nr:LysE family translocator [Marinicaulis flavus]PQA88019.1 LysE family translocator [Marinicaulis flavus]
MSIELYLAFVAATALLIITPGPVVALVVATSVRWGARRAFWIIAGTASASAIHMVLICFGLSALLAQIGQALFWIKWIGAAYLFYLGVKALREHATLSPDDVDAAAPAKSPRQLVAEGFFVALLNPKALIFYAAFFPLFVSADAPALPQLMLMAATFLAIGAVIDSGWILTADRARPLFARIGRWGNRITGGVLIMAAAGLALSRK